MKYSWKDLKIPNGKSYIFCNSHITDKTAMNIIITHTPIVTTLEMQKAYQPFEKLNVNIFAVDFSGTGKSGGREADFSLESIVTDLDSVADYIQNNFSANIHSQYNGYNHEKDNAFYKRLETVHPNIWMTSSKILLAMLECFAVADSVPVPTLVFKTLHDRYFISKHFDDYFDSLTCEKKLVEISED